MSRNEAIREVYRLASEIKGELVLALDKKTPDAMALEEAQKSLEYVLAEYFGVSSD